MRVVLQILGVAALLVGLLWVGQGLGLIMWPASSFMLLERQWAIYGIILVVLGSVLLWRARRARR